MTGTADSLADLLMREPLRRQVGLTIDPATVKGQAEGDLLLDLKLGKTARPEDTQFHATGALENLQIEKFLADEKLKSATAAFQANRNMLKIVGDGDPPRRRDPRGGRPRTRRGRDCDPNVRARRGGARQARPQLQRVAHWAAAGQAEGALEPRQRGGRNRPHASGRRRFRSGAFEAGWEPGKATFLVKPSPEGASLSNVAIELGVPMFRGSAQMDPAGGYRERHDHSGAHRGRRRFQGRCGQWSESSLKISARGASLDARAFVKSILEGASSGEAAD